MCFPGVRGKKPSPETNYDSNLGKLYFIHKLKHLSFLSEPFQNAKVGSQKTPAVTGKFGLGIQNEAGQRLLPREHTGHSKHRIPTTQEKSLHMDITRWSTPKSD